MQQKQRWSLFQVLVLLLLSGVTSTAPGQRWWSGSKNALSAVRGKIWHVWMSLHQSQWSWVAFKPPFSVRGNLVCMSGGELRL